MKFDFDQLNLCAADAEMLDRLVDVGFELDQLEGLNAEEIQRANNILAMFGVLNAYPVDDASDTLIDATLARIDQYQLQHASGMRIGTSEIEPVQRGFRIRFPDFISIAAVVLIGASVFMMINQMSRARSMSSQCASNMAMVGYGLVNYASEHNGQIPTTAAASVSSLFDGIIPERTDPSVLVDNGYCSERHLNCPSYSGESAGYSYQTQASTAWIAIAQQGKVLIVLSDRNPILEKYILGKQFEPLTPSPNHGDLGQNQLKGDGSTMPLMGPPIIGGDMIWILDNKKRNFDIFLTH